MKVILIGHGNVGKHIEEVLAEHQVGVDLIVKSTGVYAAGKKILDNNDFRQHVGDDTVVFISVPSVGDGAAMLHYYTDSLERGARVVTCEKAVLANHWNLVDDYRKQLRYSATVGGDSGILPAINAFNGEVHELRAILNGTLNYIADAFAEGATEETVFKEVVEKGYTDPGPHNLQDVFVSELKDVGYKAAILANHAGFYEHILTPADVALMPYTEGARCAVVATREKLTAGFQRFEDASWFSHGVTNCLYINGEKVAEGAGAGGRITAERMFKDFRSFNEPGETKPRQPQPRR